MKSALKWQEADTLAWFFSVINMSNLRFEAFGVQISSSVHDRLVNGVKESGVRILRPTYWLQIGK